MTLRYLLMDARDYVRYLLDRLTGRFRRCHVVDGVEATRDQDPDCTCSAVGYCAIHDGPGHWM